MTDIATLSIKVDSADVGRADSALNGLGNTANWLEGMLAKALAALAAYKLADHIQEATLLAARYETLGVVMGVVGNNAGFVSGQMQLFEDSLRHQGISALESRNALVMMAGSQMDLASASQLARVAQDAAVIGGLNSSEAFSRMIQGIRSGETEILKTIGITVNFEQAYKRAAEAAHKKSDALTEHEKVLIRQNEVMGQGVKISGAYEASMGTAGKQMKSMERYVQDLKVETGQVFGGAFMAMVDSATEALKGMDEWINKNRRSVDGIGMSFEFATREVGRLGSDIIGMLAVTSNISEEWTAAEIAAAGFATVVALILDIVNLVIGAVQTVAGAIGTAVSGMAYLLEMANNWATGSNNTKFQEWFDFNLEFTDRGLQRTRMPAVGRLMRGEGFGPDLDAEKKAEAARAAQEAARIAEEKKRRAAAEAEARERAAVEAAKAYVAELKRQKSAVDDLYMDMLKLTASEAELLSLRIDGMKLSPEQDARARRIAAEITAIKTAAEVQKTFNETLASTAKAMEEISRLNPGTTASYAAWLGSERNEELRKLANDVNSRNMSSSRRARLMEQDLNEARDKFGLDSDAYTRELRKIRAEGEMVWGILEEGGSNAARTMGDAFAEFCTGTGLNFREMTRSILADLARIASNRAFAQLIDIGLNAWMGGGEGVFTDTSSASSGIVPIGTSVMPSITAPTIASAPAKVEITINDNGSRIDSNTAGPMGQEIAEVVNRYADSRIAHQLRKGGLIERAINA